MILPQLGFGQSTGHLRKIGYALDFQKITKERMQYAKSLGIDYIELSGIGALLNKDLTIKVSEQYWSARIDSIKRILDETGIKVWSIHMPFSKQIDLSLANEDERKYVVNAQINLLSILRRAEPNIILFHPSYYLDQQGRSHRKDQLVKSVNELYKVVRRYRLEMVVENMLGPTLLVGDRERPLLRTVEECLELFKRFPKKVGLAVDMCHIAMSENLLLAFGKRVKTLHVSDGDGTAETHYLPCNGLGKNNWNEIFKALDHIGYKGVFMYECKFKDERELVDCYQLLQDRYVETLLKN